MTNDGVRTEVRGLNVVLNGANLTLSSFGNDLIPPMPLDTADAERLRIEMAKAQLWEWNQLEELKSRAEIRYRRYLGSWLVMCLAAFSAYIGYPSPYLCIAFSLLSIFLWWRAGLMEKKAAEEARAERNKFRADWDYLRQRVEESEVSVAAPPTEAGSGEK